MNPPRVSLGTPLSNSDDEAERLRKIIGALVRRAEHDANTQHTDFSLFQAAIQLEGQVRERTTQLEAAVAANEKANFTLQQAKAQLETEIHARIRASDEREKIQRELLEVSRLAGMAEVATGVLHNVGNVLNSVNVSATLVVERLQHSRTSQLEKVVALFEHHAADIGDFLQHDPRGQKLPEYLRHLSEQLQQERAGMSAELAGLRKNIEHIRDIVAMQQSYTRVSGVTEPLNAIDLVGDALQMHSAALARHDVSVIREFCAPVVNVVTDRHKVLQILVNLIVNAKQACDDAGRADKRITVRVACDATTVRLAVGDNGVGIPPENLTRIFALGFTTRRAGHGFGLHSAAIAAREVGGALRVASDGPGCGATFTLELPLKITP